VACQNTKRNYILIEKEPEYIKIIEARIGVKAEVNYLDSRTPEERKEESKIEPITTTSEVKGLSKCCNAKIIQGYCEMCCEKVK
jgi:hypothetical protein